ncbi:ribosome silencing factor [Hydrogenophaga sp.]|uniref:ribosome silencing factor n=1 Tax=Hydrogenophaga sp. TaxID=1904254 RepID=UPI0019B4C888|nr:ribosome silencing factor [Hydrogenophaga sp.]MBD3894095.1 ribosome silencing factor [Hydrogenophaga sp.]
MSEITAKRDIQKLQRAIVDGLEDVKGQDIVVFNTAEISPLFERVIVASGSSNRQTKALAASVRDAVREAGFDKPRIEGEENGEWIIVDCGAAVAHVMQPVIRQYYRLEDIWGGKPVRLKHGAEKPVPPLDRPAGKPRSKKDGVNVPAVPAKTVARKRAQSASQTEALAGTIKAKPKTAIKARTAGAEGAAVKNVSVKKTMTTQTGDGAPTKPKLKTLVVKPRAAAKPAGPASAKTPAKTPATKRTKKPVKQAT